MSHSGKPLDFDGDLLGARPGMPTAPSIMTIALAAALVVYALGFVALYPLVQSAASKSAAEGNDPALIGFVAP
jgi:hypothetical protein